MAPSANSRVDAQPQLLYPGTAVRTQTPIATLQTHISYSMSVKAWAAFDATWYRGGQASVNSIPLAVAEPNSRVGRDAGLSDRQWHAIKVGWSTVAFVRSGADFTTSSLGWQAGWLHARPAHE